MTERPTEWLERELSILDRGMLVVTGENRIDESSPLPPALPSGIMEVFETQYGEYQEMIGLT